MQFNFSEALKQLRPGAAFLIANQARPAANYLFGLFLPERTIPSYEVQNGTMIVRTTMAGLVGMDSPYPEGGVIETSTFLQKSAKMANRTKLPEEALRTLQEMLMRLQLSSSPTVEVVQREALNFLDKVIVQAHLDTMEWLRGEALVTGKLDWTFNSKKLAVDYGLPAANFLANRTGNDAYAGSASKFWDDIALLQRRLRYNVRAYVLHPDTWDVILANPVNNIEVLSMGGANGVMTYRIRRIVARNGNNLPSPDARETIEIITYGLEAEIYDLANPGKTKRVPFMRRGKILAVANNTGGTAYVVGQGSTPAPEFALGYTHLAPTVEAGGVAGRWAEVYTPQDEPWTIEGRGVTNGLPVIEANYYDKLAVASTDMPA